MNDIARTATTAAQKSNRKILLDQVCVRALVSRGNDSELSCPVIVTMCSVTTTHNTQHHIAPHTCSIHVHMYTRHTTQGVIEGKKYFRKDVGRWNEEVQRAFTVHSNMMLFIFAVLEWVEDEVPFGELATKYFQGMIITLGTASHTHTLTSIPHYTTHTAHAHNILPPSLLHTTHASTIHIYSYNRCSCRFTGYTRQHTGTSRFQRETQSRAHNQ